MEGNGFDSDDPQHSNKTQGENRPTKNELGKILAQNPIKEKS